jgi:hypothetical protein
MYGSTEQNISTKAAHARYSPFPALTVIPIATWVLVFGNVRRTRLIACDLLILADHILAPIKSVRAAKEEEQAAVKNVTLPFAIPLRS